LSETEIARLRDEIADVDREIVGLVAKRLDLASQVGLEKELLGLPLRDDKAEEQVHARLSTEVAKRGISPSLGAGLARLLIEESVRRQAGVFPPAPVVSWWSAVPAAWAVGSADTSVLAGATSS